MSDSPIWDIGPDDPRFGSLSPKAKKLRCRAALERKIVIIEEHARDPRSAPSDLPKNRTKLREWPDHKRKLWAWSDSKVDNQRGPNGDLTARFYKAVELLTLPGAVSKKDQKLAALEEQLNELRRERDALARENANLLEGLLELGP